MQAEPSESQPEPRDKSLDRKIFLHKLPGSSVNLFLSGNYE